MLMLSMTNDADEGRNEARTSARPRARGGEGGKGTFCPAQKPPVALAVKAMVLTVRFHEAPLSVSVSQIVFARSIVWLMPVAAMMSKKVKTSV